MMFIYQSFSFLDWFVLKAYIIFINKGDIMNLFPIYPYDLFN